MTYRVETFDIAFERIFNCVTDSMDGVKQLLELCEGLNGSKRIKVTFENELLLKEVKKEGGWVEVN